MIPVLTKCIEELKAANPRIEYVLGVLETLVEMQAPPPVRLIAMPAGSTAPAEQTEGEATSSYVTQTGPIAALH